MILESEIGDLIKQYDIKTVATFSPMSSAHDLLAKVAPMKGVEGFVVAFGDHRVKAKADAYLRLHKAFDRIREERHVVDLWLNNEIDDLIPHLDKSGIDRVNRILKETEDSINNVSARLNALANVAKERYGNDRKRIALEMVPMLAFKEDASVLFRLVAGDSVHEQVMKRLADSVGKRTRYEEIKEWMGPVSF